MIEMDLKALYLLVVSFFSNGKEPKQVRLEKVEEKRKFKFDLNYKFIIAFAIFVIIFGIIIYQIWVVGSLESTGYYYRLH